MATSGIELSTINTFPSRPNTSSNDNSSSDATNVKGTGPTPSTLPSSSPSATSTTSRTEATSLSPGIPWSHVTTSELPVAEDSEDGANSESPLPSQPSPPLHVGSMALYLSSTSLPSSAASLNAADTPSRPSATHYTTTTTTAATATATTTITATATSRSTNSEPHDEQPSFYSDSSFVRGATIGPVVGSSHLFPSSQITPIVLASDVSRDTARGIKGEGLGLSDGGDDETPAVTPGVGVQFSTVATNREGSVSPIPRSGGRPEHVTSTWSLSGLATAAGPGGALSLTEGGVATSWGGSSSSASLSPTPRLPDSTSAQPWPPSAAAQSNVSDESWAGGAASARVTELSRAAGVSASSGDGGRLATTTSVAGAQDVAPVPTPVLRDSVNFASSVVTQPPPVVGMASGNVTASSRFVNATDVDATEFLTSPNPPANALTPKTTIVDPGIGDNSSSPVWPTRSSSPLVESVTSSSETEGDDSSFNSSSASLWPSTPDSSNQSFLPTSSDVTPRVTTSILNVTDSSGDVVEEATATATSVVEIVPTTVISTSSSSDVLCNGSLSSTHGNCTGLSGDTAPVLSPLVIVLPVCVALLLFVVIVMSLLCIRRNKNKGRKSSQEDLWVGPARQQVPAISLSVPAMRDSSPLPSMVFPAAPEATQTVSDDESGEPLFVAIYDFPCQLDSQLPLTPGDVIVVREKVDNGWWRGNIKGDDRCGWFPSSFVVPIQQDAVQPTEEAEGEPEQEAQTQKPRISSFLIRKKQGNRSLKENNSFSLRKITPQAPSVAISRSASALTPVAPLRLTPATTAPLCADDFSAAIKGKYFKALFAYKAAFRGELSLREGEVIEGRERDGSGWMLGRKVHGKEEGWFPAVYVDEVKGDVSLVKEASPGKGHVTSQLDHDVYGLLAVNRNKSPDQSWVGIEHMAVKTYEARSSEQLSVRAGDVVVVVEALECGWWLGHQGDQVGWFPGDHVELLEEKSEKGLDDSLFLPLRRGTHPNQHQLVQDDNDASKRSSLASSLDPRDLQEKKLTHALSKESVLSEGDKPRPARKAPKPPVQGHRHLTANMSGTGTLSRNPRPMRPAPAPPCPRARSASAGPADRLSVAGSAASPGGQVMAAVVVPKKQRKPKVVRIPKEKLGLDKISSCPVPAGIPTANDTSAVPAENSAPPLPRQVSSEGQTGDVCSQAEEAVKSVCTDSEGEDSSVLPTDRNHGDGAGDSPAVCDDVNSGEDSHTTDVTTTTTVPRVQGEDDSHPEIEQHGSGAEGRKDSAPEDTEATDKSHGDSVPTGDKANLSLSCGNIPDLSEEMSIFIPGLTDDSRVTELVGPNSPVSIVETAPTPTDQDYVTPMVPERSSPVNVEPAGEDDEDTVTLCTPDLPAGENTAQNESQSPCSMAENTELANAEDVVAQPSLADSFKSPLMVDVRPSSPNSTSRYVRPPQELLDEAEESWVDALSGQSSPASSETSSKSSSSSKPTGYWRFHSGSNGHSPKGRPTKLTKVAPPVVPKPGAKSREDEESVADVPPPGRVHKIVNQINKMASVEEHQPPLRRPSLQQQQSPVHLRTGSLPETSSGANPIKPQHRLSPRARARLGPAPLPPTHTHSDSESLVNGGLGSSHTEDRPADSDSQHEAHSRVSPCEQSDGDSSLSGQRKETADTPADRDSEKESQADVCPSDPSDVALSPSYHRQRSRSRSRSRSREGTPDSEGEGERRQSSKKTRAPPPPSSPPPPPPVSSPPFPARKFQGLTVTGEEATEC